MRSSRLAESPRQGEGQGLEVQLYTTHQYRGQLSSDLNYRLLNEHACLMEEHRGTSWFLFYFGRRSFLSDLTLPSD